MLPKKKVSPACKSGCKYPAALGHRLTLATRSLRQPGQCQGSVRTPPGLGWKPFLPFPSLVSEQPNDTSSQTPSVNQRSESYLRKQAHCTDSAPGGKQILKHIHVLTSSARRMLPTPFSSPWNQAAMHRKPCRTFSKINLHRLCAT